MENSNPILTELTAVSPVVAGIEKRNCLSVPEGYFEGFARRMLMLAREQAAHNELGSEQEPQLSIAKQEVPYKVPTGYFEGLAERMLHLVHAEDLKLHFLQQKLADPYSVPAEYFQELPARMLSLVKGASENRNKAIEGLESSVSVNDSESVSSELESLSPLLGGLTKSMPFSIPDGYFDKLNSAAVTSSQNEKDPELSAELASIRKVNVYSVPAGYFDRLSETIVNRVVTKQHVDKHQNVKEEAKVVKGNFGRQFFRYAAAAVLVAALVTTAFFIFKPGADNSTLAQQQGIPNDIEKKIEQTSDDAIFSYLDDQDLSYVDPALVNDGAQLDDEAIKSLLADIPDEAIENYLGIQSDARQPLTN